MDESAKRPEVVWPPNDDSFWGEPDTDPEASFIVEVRLLETPVKRKNDNKEYRAIELRNGFEALLIADDSGANACIGCDSRAASVTENYGRMKRRGSDSMLSILSTTYDRIDGSNDVNVPFKRLNADGKMAAFGLSIGVGSYNDPPEVPGMARFLEHMIVIGSKKYPQEYGFDYFVKGCGGPVDAFTGSDQTTFKVTVPEQFFPHENEPLVTIKKNNWNMSNGNCFRDTRLSIVRLTHWSTIQKRNAVSGIKLEEFKHFIKSFTYRTYIQCLGQGNIEGIDVIQNVQDCIATLECGPLHPHVRPYVRLTEVPLGVRCCRVKSRDPDDRRSAVVNYYQLPNTLIRSTIEILNIMLHDPSFEEFRNQKRLDGYEYRLLMDPSDVLGYFIEGNSKFRYVCEIDWAIEKFRKSFNEILKELSEQEMLTAMVALVNAKKCTDICLKAEVVRNWAEIISESYVFDRLRREVDAISNLTITDLKSSIIDCTAAGPNLRKLSVQVVGNGNYETSTVPTEGQDDGIVLPVSQNTGVYPVASDRGDDTLEYLTDAPKAEKKIDYYITDIEEDKRNRVVLSAHSSGV